MILWNRLNIRHVLIHLLFFYFHEICYKQMIYITDDEHVMHFSHPLSLLTIKT